MSACVSPPQESVSHMVEVAAIIAQAASTALPPRSKIIAPAVAASGLPVTAIQCAPWSAGFWVRASAGARAAASSTAVAASRLVRVRTRRAGRTGGFPRDMRTPFILVRRGRSSIWQTYPVRTASGAVVSGAGTLDSELLRQVEVRGRPGTALLTRLFIYPVKSTRSIELTSAEIAATGLEWDRRWMIVDDRGRFLTQRERPKLARVVPEIRSDALVLSAPGRPDLVVPFDSRGPGVTVTVWRFTGEALEEDAAAHEWLSEFLGESVRLVKVSPQMGRVANPDYAREEAAPISFTDGYPFLVCNEASLSDLNTRLPGAMSMECFRPNLVLEGLPPWAEDHIETLSFAGATLRLVKPCTRCAIPTRDFRTG